jgi:phosphopentomutase
MGATKGGIMKTVYVALLIGMLSGCATTPSGHWEQAGRTEQETQDDFAHCEQVAYLDSQRNKTDEPFKGPIIEKNCMQRLGYNYINNSK